MKMQRQLIGVEVTSLGEDEVEVIMSTAALARDTHVLVPEGCLLNNYLRNNIWLWSHNPDIPTGNGEDVSVGRDGIRARVKFAPLGISPEADKYNRLVKAGVVKAVSIGFEPIEMEPLDPKKPRGGQRITKWELMEASWVSVPADPNALVTARSIGDDMTILAEATEAVADPVAAAVTAPQPEPRANRALATRGVKIAFKRGLYEVSSLCYLFESLGYQVDYAKWEAAIEGDQSKVPAMLAAVLSDLGDAILAMTQEEIAEALAGRDVEAEGDGEDDVVLVVEERAHIDAAQTPAIRDFRRGIAFAKVRAGKSLSAETVRCLREAKTAHEDAMDLHRSAIRKHREGLATINDMMDRAGVSDPENNDTETVQTSGGTGVDEGSEASRARADFRRRQVETLALAATE